MQKDRNLVRKPEIHGKHERDLCYKQDRDHEKAAEENPQDPLLHRFSKPGNSFFCFRTNDFFIHIFPSPIGF